MSKAKSLKLKRFNNLNNNFNLLSNNKDKTLLALTLDKIKKRASFNTRLLKLYSTNLKFAKQAALFFSFVDKLAFLDFINYYSIQKNV